MKSNERLKVAGALMERLRHLLPGGQQSDPETHYGEELGLRGALGGGVGGAATGYLAGPSGQASLRDTLMEQLSRHPEIDPFELKILAEQASSPELLDLSSKIRPPSDFLEHLVTRGVRGFLGMSPGKLALLGGGLGAAGLGALGMGAGNMGDAVHHLFKHSSRRPMLKAAVVADQFVKAAIIRQEGEGYTLFSHKGKVLGRHPSKGKAIAQEQAIKAHGG
jgi:hypothetical protein